MARSDQASAHDIPLTEKLRLDERFSWSFTGVVLAVLFGIVGLYTALRESHPNLVIEIENQADVLDVHRPLQDLKLLFRGQDIQQQNLNLRIFTIRISNKGREDILQGQYDQDGTWGIKVSTGQIIEVRLSTNNSSYLAERISPEITSADTVTLKKVIFERDRYVTRMSWSFIIKSHRQKFWLLAKSPVRRASSSPISQDRKASKDSGSS
jgi:hypothetical protein